MQQMKPEQFSNKILRWFDQHGRHDLPWQKNQSPYRVWVSEIMLQQTQVSTVIPYFQRFMKSFPSLKALATANLDDVLAHWSGLGYYARARNLHRTAQIIHTEFAGRFPRTVDNLSNLPGIGRSTAGAIVSLAMELPAAILDGNVKRVLTRYYGIEGWTGEQRVLNRLWELSEALTPEKRCRDYNQAMMDLGATRCTRRQPQCMRCPLRTHCEAFSTNRQHDFPTPKKQAQSRNKATCMLLLQNTSGAILLEKRPTQGIWGGLWSFPECATEEVIAQWCAENIAFPVLETQRWPTRYHQFSHFRLAIHPFLLTLESAGDEDIASDTQVWYKREDPLPGGVAAPVAQLLTALRDNHDTHDLL